MKMDMNKWAYLLALLAPMTLLGLWLPPPWVWAVIGVPSGYVLYRLTAPTARAFRGPPNLADSFVFLAGVLLSVGAESAIVSRWHSQGTGPSRYDLGLFTYFPCVLVGGFLACFIWACAARNAGARRTRTEAGQGLGPPPAGGPVGGGRESGDASERGGERAGSEQIGE